MFHQNETAQQVTVKFPDLDTNLVYPVRNHNKYKESNEDLIYNIQNGIDVKKSKELLVKKNSGMVYTTARKCTYHIPLEDKIQYCYESLLEACYAFDLSKGAKFSTYCHRVIMMNLFRRASVDNYTISMPDYLSVNSISVNNFRTSFKSKFHKEPSDDEIANSTGISIKQVKSIRTFQSKLVSFDTPIDNDNLEGSLDLGSVLTIDNPDHKLDESIFEKEFDALIEEILDNLEEHERVLFALVNGLDSYRKHTLQEILDSGYIDEKGEWVRSKPTLSRKYNAVLDKIKKMIKNGRLVR